MFQCYSGGSSSSSSSGGSSCSSSSSSLGAVVCHWQFSIETSFLVLQSISLCVVTLQFTQYLTGKSHFRPIVKVILCFVDRASWYDPCK